MQPGLARAVPLGIVGFIVGALIAIVIRMAQGLDPNPDAPLAFVGPAMVLGAFLSSGFFVWGMGAFDPRMNVHGEEHAIEPAEAAKAESPLAILGGYTWQMTFWLILMVFAIAVFAFLPGGPTIRSVQGDDGNVAAIGYTEVPLPFGGPTVTVSYLVLFIVFVAWTIFSLFLTAGLIAFIIGYFAQGKANPNAVSIPWKALIFVLLLVSLGQLPLMVPSLELPTALIMPAFILPQLVLLIGYRKPIWLLLLLLAMPLPVLVPTVTMTALPVIALVWIVVSFIALGFFFARSLLAPNTWRVLALLTFSIAAIAMIGITISETRGDFWQMVFFLVLTIIVLGLLAPVEWLKFVIPAEMWSRYAAIDWPMLIPQLAGVVARWLRGGLPKFLGQR